MDELNVKQNTDVQKSWDGAHIEFEVFVIECWDPLAPSKVQLRYMPEMSDEWVYLMSYDQGLFLATREEFEKNTRKMDSFGKQKNFNDTTLFMVHTTSDLYPICI